MVLKETGIIACGEAVGVALMYGVFLLLHAFSTKVLLGGIAGGVFATGNFFFMAMGLNNLADKAQGEQEAKSAAGMARFSYIIRMAVILALLFVLVKTGVCDALACVIPFFFVRITIMIREFFKKKPEVKNECN